MKTDLVVVIAIKENEKNNLSRLFKVFSKEKVRKLIRCATTSKEILNILMNDTN